MSPSNDTIRELLKKGETRLIGCSVENARRNAEWILCRILSCTILDLYVNSQETTGDGPVARYWSMIERRAMREPLQHILGSTEFMSLPFEVRPGVFVPRPETETLVEAAEETLRRRPVYDNLSIADLCCGSGVVGVSLACRIPNVEVSAVDISLEAVELTRANGDRNGARKRLRVFRGDAVEFLSQRNPTVPRFSAILCNPPYIESGRMKDLPPEVREYDPRPALDGGSDGLDFYRRVIPVLPAQLVPGGSVLFEIGFDQGAAVSSLLQQQGFVDLRVIRDLSGKDRVVSGSMGVTNG